MTPIEQTVLPVIHQITPGTLSVKGYVPIEKHTFTNETQFTLPSGVTYDVQRVGITSDGLPLKNSEYFAIVFPIDGLEAIKNIVGLVTPQPEYYDVHTGKITDNTIVKALREGMNPSEIIEPSPSKPEVKDSFFRWSITNAMFNIRVNKQLQLNWVNALTSSLPQNESNEVQALHIAPVTIPEEFKVSVFGTGNTYNGTAVNDILVITLVKEDAASGNYELMFQITSNNVNYNVKLTIELG